MRVRRSILPVAAAAVAVAAGLLAPTAAGASAPAPGLSNPGFEADGTATATPAGWRSTGRPGTARTEAGGHTGGFALVQSASVETAQRVSASRGWVTLQAWVRTTTAAGASYVALRGCGGPEERATVPPSAAWIRVVVSARVRSRDCTIVLHTAGGAGERSEFDDVALTPGRAALSVLGADVSSLDKSESLGGVYRDRSGRPGDALRILKAGGMNWIRLRAWVDPAEPHHDTAELLRMARRAKAAGLDVLVDLHYSDFWADPGKQWTPAAWQGKPFAELERTFADYTRGVVAALVAQGTPPAMVQVGNEINSGLVWDYAATWTGCSSADDGLGGTRTECHTENWDHLAELLTAGYQAVKSASPQTKVMLHLADGGDNGAYRFWFDNVTTRGVPFDVIGASFYGYFHGPLSALQANLDDVSARYGKDVIVAETAYPFTLEGKDGLGNIIGLESQLIPGYPATPAGQAAWLRDLETVVRAVPGGRGLGMFYWDATWTAVPGNGWSPRDQSSGNAWENQALFDYGDRLLPAAFELRP